MGKQAADQTAWVNRDFGDEETSASRERRKAAEDKQRKKAKAKADKRAKERQLEHQAIVKRKTEEKRRASQARAQAKVVARNKLATGPRRTVDLSLVAKVVAGLSKKSRKELATCVKSAGLVASEERRLASLSNRVSPPTDSKAVKDFDLVCRQMSPKLQGQFRESARIIAETEDISIASLDRLLSR